jgi:hypothetical protein
MIWVNYGQQVSLFGDIKTIAAYRYLVNLVCRKLKQFLSERSRYLSIYRRKDSAVGTLSIHDATLVFIRTFVASKDNDYNKNFTSFIEQRSIQFCYHRLYFVIEFSKIKPFRWL